MEIEAFILVGGRSSRFGRDKSAVEFGDKTLVERIVANIFAGIAPPRITLVAADNEQLMGASALSLSLPFIFDLYGGRGPVGGLHAALAYAGTHWVFVAACDPPFLSSELIARLSGVISEDVDAVVPTQSDGRVQPLCAFYRRKPCLQAVEEILLNGRSAPPLKAILDHVRTRYVSFEEVKHLPGAENFFLNMNTPADLERAMEIDKIS